MRQDAKWDYVRETERAAQLLGLPSYGPGADAAIVEYCRRQVSLLTAQHGLPETMGELLARVASCLDVEFAEIHSDEDLARLLHRLPLEGWETSSDGPIGHGQLFVDCEVLDDEVVALTSIARD